MGGFFLHTPHVCEHQDRAHSHSSVWKEQPSPAAELHLLTVILGGRLLLKQLHLSAAKWLAELSQVIKGIYWLLLCKPSSHRSALDKH